MAKTARQSTCAPTATAGAVQTHTATTLDQAPTTAPVLMDIMRMGLRAYFQTYANSTTAAAAITPTAPIQHQELLLALALLILAQQTTEEHAIQSTIAYCLTAAVATIHSALSIPATMRSVPATMDTHRHLAFKTTASPSITASTATAGASILRYARSLDPRPRSVLVSLGITRRQDQGRTVWLLRQQIRRQQHRRLQRLIL